MTFRFLNGDHALDTALQVQEISQKSPYLITVQSTIVLKTLLCNNTYYGLFSRRTFFWKLRFFNSDVALDTALQVQKSAKNHHIQNVHGWID